MSGTGSTVAVSTPHLPSPFPVPALVPAADPALVPTSIYAGISYIGVIG